MRRRSVLITGASSGIGKATAHAFADAGFRAFGTSRRHLPDDEGVEMLRLDVRSDDSVRACVTEALSRAGRIDVLVNNAGVEHLGIAEETTLEEARDVFDTNFFGAVRVTDAVLPAMRERGGGRVINIGSAAAWVGEPGEAFYSASKRALAGWTEALRHEVRPLGIAVSLIEPGAFRTGIVESASTAGPSIRDYDVVRHAALRTLRRGLERGCDPRRVAQVVVEAARARSPRLRYAVGTDARWLPYLRVLLPQRLFEWLVRRGFGLDG